MPWPFFVSHTTNETVWKPNFNSFLFDYFGWLFSRLHFESFRHSVGADISLCWHLMTPDDIWWHLLTSDDTLTCFRPALRAEPWLAPWPPLMDTGEAPDGHKAPMLMRLFFRPSTGIPVLHSGSHFRHGLLQLMIHTIDPLHDGSSNFGSYFLTRIEWLCFINPHYHLYTVDWRQPLLWLFLWSKIPRSFILNLVISN